jgi:hypothetical protein
MYTWITTNKPTNLLNIVLDILNVFEIVLMIAILIVPPLLLLWKLKLMFSIPVSILYLYFVLTNGWVILMSILGVRTFILNVIENDNIPIGCARRIKGDKNSGLWCI